MNKQAIYIAKLRAAGKPIGRYRIVGCGHYAETLLAPRGERWDTLATCAECGNLHMKITHGSTVTTLDLPS